MATVNAIVLSAGASVERLPAVVDRWLDSLGVSRLELSSGDEVMVRALRARPRVIVVDDRTAGFGEALATVRRLKADSYTGVVPVIVLTSSDAAAFRAAFTGGADEVLSDDLSVDQMQTRLEAIVRRSDRDLNVHPSTRLPGTVEIDAEIARRLTEGLLFATCYADLDHFKEFNDRYSYREGDRIIRILATILHDVVKGTCGERGFVGHIGGDDFIFIIPLPAVDDVCGEIIRVFDALVPVQYSEQDRRAGYFFGKDRRGQLHRVPLMTVSIGVVTNERHAFTHAAQISAVATEMKGYAKTLPGSVFSIDRRTDAVADAAGPAHPSVAATAGKEP